MKIKFLWYIRVNDGMIEGPIDLTLRTNGIESSPGHTIELLNGVTVGGLREVPSHIMQILLTYPDIQDVPKAGKMNRYTVYVQEKRDQSDRVGFQLSHKEAGELLQATDTEGVTTVKRSDRVFYAIRYRVYHARYRAIANQFRSNIIGEQLVGDKAKGKTFTYQLQSKYRVENVTPPMLRNADKYVFSILSKGWKNVKIVCNTSIQVTVLEPLLPR